MSVPVLTTVICIGAVAVQVGDDEDRSPTRGSVEVGSWIAGGRHGPVLGVELHLGVRMTDELAAYVLGQGALVMPTGLLGLLLEYQVSQGERWTFAVAGGVGVFAASNAFNEGGGHVAAVGAPFRLICAHGEFHQFFVALDGFLGTPSPFVDRLQKSGRSTPTPDVAGVLGLSLGYRLR